MQSEQIEIVVTRSIKNAMDQDRNFEQFVMACMKRHLSGDWGDTCKEDAALNNEDPCNALSAYTYENDIKIWLKRDYDVLTILYPSEY